MNETLQEARNLEVQHEKLKSNLKKAEGNTGILNMKISALE